MFEPREHKTVSMVLGVSMLLAMFSVAASSTTLAVHNCSIDGHACPEPETVEVEVVKEVKVECGHSYSTLAATSSATLVEKSLLLELSALNQYSASYSDDRLDIIYKLKVEEAVRETDVVNAKQMEIDLLKAKTANIEVQLLNDKALNKWLSSVPDHAKAQEKLQKTLEHLRYMTVLAKAINQQNTEMLQAVKALESIEVADGVPLLSVESSDSGPFLTPYKRKQYKNMAELKVAEAEFFLQMGIGQQ